MRTDIFRRRMNLGKWFVGIGIVMGIVFAAWIDVNQAAPAAAVSFSDQSLAAGLDFMHTPPDDNWNEMISGATAIDYDNDGWQDLLVLGGGFRADALYHNNGDGTFTDVAEAAGVDALHAGSGTAVGDYDGDGWDDIFVASLGLVSAFGDAAVPTTSIAWGDLDGDGDQDIVVGNDGAPNQLYQNQGDGTFVELADAFGSDANKTTSVALGDLNGDQDMDVVFGNSGEVNQVYANQGGVFVEIAGALGSAARTTTSVALGDLDKDTDLDLAVGNADGTNQIFENQGNGTFIEVNGALSGESHNTTSLEWGDVDNDNDQDLVIGNLDAVNQLYTNQNGVMSLVPLAFGNVISATTSLDLADIDDDGDLDLAFGNTNGQYNSVYENQGGGVFVEQVGALDYIQRDTTAVAWGDVNMDGLLDLAVGNENQLNQLYLNQAAGFYAETDIEKTMRIYTLPTTSLAWGFANDDSQPDLVIGNFGSLNQLLTSSLVEGALMFSERRQMGPGHHRLYHNNGDGTFTDVAESAGVRFSNTQQEDGFGAAFGDYDLDGDLDLFVSGWQRTTAGDVLFRNNGDGTFTDVTAAVGIIDDGIRGFTPCFADMDGDWYPDLMLVADFGTTEYYINVPGSTAGPETRQFQNATSNLPIRPWSGMGLAVGDFNNDGRTDWYITDIYGVEGRDRGNRLYINQGNHQFTEIAQSAGVIDGAWGWGSVAVDLDHDGWQDLVETNGWHLLEEFTDNPTRVWLHNGNGSAPEFTEIAAASGLIHNLDGRSALRFDYDNDGDQDIVLASTSGALKLFRNDLTGAEHNWLRVFLDTSSKPGLAPGGFGSRVQVTAGGKTYTRGVWGCGHYQSHSELSAHFGLGPADQIEEVKVMWSDGSETVLTGIDANQTLTIKAGDFPPAVASEGELATNSGSMEPLGKDVVSLAVSIGTIVDNQDGTWSWNFLTTDGPDESQTVTITATNTLSEVSTAEFELVVNNAPPTISVDKPSVEVIGGATAVNTGVFGDPGVDTVTLTASVGTVVDAGGGIWSWSFAASANDSQVVTMTAADSDGAKTMVEFNLTVKSDFTYYLPMLVK